MPSARRPPQRIEAMLSIGRLVAPTEPELATSAFERVLHLDARHPVAIQNLGGTVRIKADMTCSSVAAASVLAKTTRDAIMVALAAEHPAYGFDVHKGYASPEHREALEAHGPCVQHRRSWSIPGGRTAEDAVLGDVDLSDDAALLVDS